MNNLSYLKCILYKIFIYESNISDLIIYYIGYNIDLIKLVEFFITNEKYLFNINNIFLKVFKERCNINNKNIVILNKYSEKLLSDMYKRKLNKKNINFIIFDTNNYNKESITKKRWSVISLNKNNIIQKYSILTRFKYVDDNIGGYNICNKNIIKKLTFL